MPEPIIIPAEQQLADPILSSEAELAAAFQTKSSPQQVEGQQEQVGQEGVEPGSDPSRSQVGTPPSREAGTPSREELLVSLTIDEVKNLEHLRPALKSEIDREAARQLTGKERQIEERVRGEVTADFLKKQFTEMDPEELSELLTKDPESRAAYARVMTPPPPPPANDPGQSLLSYYQNVVQTTNVRVQALPAEYKDKLDPATYAKQYPDMAPDELIAKWQGEIVDAEVAVKLAAAKPNPDEAESKRLDDSAKQENPGALIEQGRGVTGVLPDYGTRSDLLLEHAFASKSVTRR